MEGLFSVLLFAALFYVMMRFGCGAHMVHGHGSRGRDEQKGHAEHPSTAESGAMDPVCGMEVAPGTGYTKMVGGHAYRFCSRACLDKFETNPNSTRRKWGTFALRREGRPRDSLTTAA